MRIDETDSKSRISIEADHYVIELREGCETGLKRLLRGITLKALRAGTVVAVTSFNQLRPEKTALNTLRHWTRTSS